MRVWRPVVIILLVLAGAGALIAQGRGGRSGWVTIKDGEECPPGMTEARHRECAPTATPAPRSGWSARSRGPTSLAVLDSPGF